jgi:hypothetical protein
MDTFQISVLIVAAVLLILIFATVGILSKYTTTDKVFPPIANSCPDYWTVDASGNCIIPQKDGPNHGTVYTGDTINLTTDKLDTSKTYTPGYNSSSSYINFTDPIWGTLGKSTVCAKKNWAATNTLQWDGVSNYNSC